MRFWCAIGAILLLGGCGESGTTSTTITVHRNESIQAAIARAPANAVIVVEPGIYHESASPQSAVTITKPGLHLISHGTADNPVILENAAGQMNGIVVAPPDSVEISTDEHPGEHPPCGDSGQRINGFSLQGFTVRGFDQFGVYLACTDDFSLTGNHTDTDKLYGLFPVRSRRGTLTDNEAENTSLDAAIYVGQSEQVTITGNMTHDNLIGLEIENSTDVTASKNHVFHNTLGIVADINAGLQKKDQTNVLITDNDVTDNNLANSVEGGETEAAPPGTGIVVLGGSMVTVQANRISGNGFVGIIVANFCATPLACHDLDIDPNPENNRIVDNELTNNGKQPPSDPLEAQLAADLIWDKTGTGNCWSGNTPTATVKVLGGGRTLPECL